MKNDNQIDIIFNTKILQKTLIVFQNILEKKSLIPIFSNLKIEIVECRAIFSGMNIDIASINQCEILNFLESNKETNEQKNEILLSGHLFYDIVRKIDADEIHIKKKYSNNFIEISAGNFFCKMPLQENEKFPTIDTLENKDEYFILASHLMYAIESVLPCAAINDNRAFLCAIRMIQNQDGSVEFIATDGHRMAYLKSLSRQFKKREDQDCENLETLDLILPRKIASFILKYLKEDLNANIKFRISGQKIVFFFDLNEKNSEYTTTIISKIAEGNYPNYKKLLNYNYAYKLKISLKKILESLDRTLILLDEKNSKALNLEIIPTAKKLILTAQSDDKGMIRETIEDVEFLENNSNEFLEESKSIILNINAYYLYEILKSIKEQNIIIGVNNKKNPIAISDKVFEEKFYLLMPMLL